MKITIITVSYNSAATIADTLRSVALQSHPEIEHIVVDGGSTDDTLAVVKAAGSHVARIVSEPDKGIADAFNKGLARAGGEYVMFLNADDALAHPHALAGMVDAARANQWPSVVYGDCDLIDPSSGAFLYRAVINYDRGRFLARETLPHPGMLMHRRYFEKFGRFDNSFKVAMDYELFLRGVPETGALRVPDVVARVRTGGISARNRQLVIDETLRALRTHGYITPMGEAWVRATYAVRGTARRVLEGVGLYRAFDAVRRRRNAAARRA